MTENIPIDEKIECDCDDDRECKENEQKNPDPRVALMKLSEMMKESTDEYFNNFIRHVDDMKMDDKKKENYLISFYMATRDTSLAYFDVLEKIKKKIFVVKEKIPSKKNKKRK